MTYYWDNGYNHDYNQAQKQGCNFYIDGEIDPDKPLEFLWFTAFPRSLQPFSHHYPTIVPLLYLIVPLLSHYSFHDCPYSIRLKPGVFRFENIQKKYSMIIPIKHS